MEALYARDIVISNGSVAQHFSVMHSARRGVGRKINDESQTRDLNSKALLALTFASTYLGQEIDQVRWNGRILGVANRSASRTLAKTIPGQANLASTSII